MHGEPGDMNTTLLGTELPAPHIKYQLVPILWQCALTASAVVLGTLILGVSGAPGVYLNAAAREA